jgi:hypothetical protein
MRTLAAAMGSLALAWAALSGCSFSGNVNSAPTVARESLPNDIFEKLAKAGAAPRSVICHDDLVGEVGKTTVCDVDLGPTTSIEAVLKVTSINGTTVNYDSAPAVSQQQLQKSVSALTSPTAVDAVSCESGLDGTVGAVAYCSVGAGADAVRRMVDVTDIDGLSMNYTLVPVLFKADVESSLLTQLAQQLAQRPDAANCADNLQGKTGMSVDCVVTSGSQTQTYVLTVTTVDGTKINYDYQPKV